MRPTPNACGTSMQRCLANFLSLADADGVNETESLQRPMSEDTALMVPLLDIVKLGFLEPVWGSNKLILIIRFHSYIVWTKVNTVACMPFRATEESACGELSHRHSRVILWKSTELLLHRSNPVIHNHPLPLDLKAVQR